MTKAEIELKAREYLPFRGADRPMAYESVINMLTDFALQMMGEKEKVVDLHEDTETCEQCEKRFAIEFMRLDEEGYWFCKACILN